MLLFLPARAVAFRQPSCRGQGREQDEASDSWHQRLCRDEAVDDGEAGDDDGGDEEQGAKRIASLVANTVLALVAASPRLPTSPHNFSLPSLRPSVCSLRRPVHDHELGGNHVQLRRRLSTLGV